MLASVLISVVSVAFLVYWFRYSCLLLLRARAEQSPDAPAPLGILEVRDRLQTAEDLDPLLRSLERDYRVVTYLLQHSSGLPRPSLEDRLLRLDYKMMLAWYRITRTLAPEKARGAAVEMAGVLACLTRRMDPQAGL